MKTSTLLAIAAAMALFVGALNHAHAQDDAEATEASSNDNSGDKSIYVGPYFELAGAGGLYSINAEVTGEYWGARAGFSASGWWNAFPIVAYGMVGSRKHKLEAGGGVLVFAVNVSDDSSGLSVGGSAAVGVLNIGYRYQADSGFFTKVTATPFIGGGEVFFWAGWGFGWRF